MYQEYSIDHKYIILMQQTIQTNDPQIINRIEIGTIIAETKNYLLIQTMKTKRHVKKALIIRMIDISSIDLPHTQLFIDRLKDALI